MSHTDVFAFLNFFSLEMMFELLYTKTIKQFDSSLLKNCVSMCLTGRNQQKMSVCDIWKCQCVTQKTAQKDTLLVFYSYILLTIPLLSHYPSIWLKKVMIISIGKICVSVWPPSKLNVLIRSQKWSGSLLNIFFVIPYQVVWSV